MKRIWKKSCLSLTAVALVSLSGTPMAMAAENGHWNNQVPVQPHVSIVMNGQEQTFDTAPYYKNQTVMVPLRQLADQIGLEVGWMPEKPDFVLLNKPKLTSAASLQTGSSQAMFFTLQTDSTDATSFDQKTVQLAEAPEMKNGHFMVPLRSIAELFGNQVQWDGKQHAISITTSDPHASALNLSLYADVETFDTALATDEETDTVLNQIDEGLLRLDPNSKPIPGLARSWEISGDRLTYTFHLRPNAEWSDGSALTAHDFVYAWQRALDHKTNSNYAFLLYGIQNAQEFHDGKVPADQLGFTAIDDYTLQIKLNNPQPYFLEELATPTFFPQKQSFVEQQGDQYGTTPDNTLTNGPFQVESWTPGKEIVLKKSPTYWDKDNVQLQKVNYEINKTNQANLDLYGKGQLDFTYGDLSPDYRILSSYHTQSIPNTAYLDFNQNEQVFKNKKVRQALAYAMDADLFRSIMYGDNVVDATGFVPSGISDGNGGDFRQDNGDILDYEDNAAQAKDLLQQGLKEAGVSTFPSIKLLVQDNSYNINAANSVKQEWHDNLGIDIDIETAPYTQILQRTANRNFDIVFGEWGADYNDPLTFLDLYTTGNSYNVSGYSNPDYDKLIASAKQEQDSQKRMQLLRDAEKLLIQDMACIPLYFKNYHYLLEPYVKGWDAHAFGPDYDLKYTYIEGK